MHGRANCTDLLQNCTCTVRFWLSTLWSWLLVYFVVKFYQSVTACMDLSYICMYYISVLCTRVVCTSYHMATRVLVNSLHVENKLAKDPRGHVITVFFLWMSGNGSMLERLHGRINLRNEKYQQKPFLWREQAKCERVWHVKRPLHER